MNLKFSIALDHLGPTFPGIRWASRKYAVLKLKLKVSKEKQMRCEVGKIQKVSFGLGGYQDAMLGFKFTLGSDKTSWGVSTQIGSSWSHVTEEELNKPGSHYQWTHQSRIEDLGKAAYKVSLLMEKAKVTSFDKLIGIPIKAYFNQNNVIEYFEIYEEVI
jgi:hypothetical protein